MDNRKPPEVVEVMFKGERKEFFLNQHGIPIRIGDYCIVQAERGEDMGTVIQRGEYIQKRGFTGGLKRVLRNATEDEVKRLKENRERERDALRFCQERSIERALNMKLVDSEYQFDRNRITFYFTADKRVDFRELVKDLASKFKTRIEMRQIGVRDEAKRLGGYGTCGLAYCCTTYLKEFEPVTLKMAKDQQLSLSPSKISGACGRLMCCLMYEVDFYREAARTFPRVGSRVALREGSGEITRLDYIGGGVYVVDELGTERRLSLKDIHWDFESGKSSKKS
ncbi:MAG: regulatory iron-sulfur-containing complex subunit RicT [Candidatus Eisenbacteria bacterium]|nr:regulatory iron-sulfur-containing complex subunit RicT [Candidatus Eisenbacteria bacterium]